MRVVEWSGSFPRKAHGTYASSEGTNVWFGDRAKSSGADSEGADQFVASDPPEISARKFWPADMRQGGASYALHVSPALQLCQPSRHFNGSYAIRTDWDS